MPWYAAYTKSRTEKKVLALLEEKQIEVFLPLKKEWRQWSDRKKKVELPLIPSYIFVKINESQDIPVLETPGVVAFVKFEGKKVAIPEKQIKLLETIVNNEFETELTNQSFQSGQEVEILQGPFKGLIGTVIEQKGKFKLVISIDAINQSLLITIPASFLK
jgi:transcriptional antiterminator RfaH